MMKAPLIGSANLLPQYGCRFVVITSHLETMVEFTALQLQFHEPAGLKKSQEVFPVASHLDEFFFSFFSF